MSKPGRVRVNRNLILYKCHVMHATDGRIRILLLEALFCHRFLLSGSNLWRSGHATPCTEPPPSVHADLTEFRCEPVKEMLMPKRNRTELAMLSATRCFVVDMRCHAARLGERLLELLNL